MTTAYIKWAMLKAGIDEIQINKDNEVIAVVSAKILEIFMMPFTNRWCILIEPINGGRPTNLYCDQIRRM
jgi:hypothetical protein